MIISAPSIFSSYPSENVSLFIFVSFALAALSILFVLKHTPSNSPITSKKPTKYNKGKYKPLSREHIASAKQHTYSTLFVSSLRNMLATTVPRPIPVPETVVSSVPVSRTASATMVQRTIDTTARLDKPVVPSSPPKQPFDSYLVLDVEATCMEGTDFNWPNEIIEWPVCLLQWQEKGPDNRERELVLVDEFRSFVKPTWKPTLSEFCTKLTGITQEDVQSAPNFPQVLKNFREFLVRNGLIDDATGKRLQRFTWCSDGPYDVRDFVVKQCFISKTSAPEWLRGDILDVRQHVTSFVARQSREPLYSRHHRNGEFRRRSLNIVQQLRALGLSGFEGRQHCGIDDARNIARIMQELAKRGEQLLPNTYINFSRRWQWMGSKGHVLEEYCTIPGR